MAARADMSSGGDGRIDSVIELLTRLATGDLDARGARTGTDEDLDAVIVGINMLAEELMAHRSELEQRVQARTVELEAARREATEATRLKSEFLATMSHEIRTPLNGVIGLTELLLRTQLEQSQQQLVEGIFQASRTLLGLLSDILDLSKIEAGKLELEAVDFEPRTILDHVIAVLSGTAQTRHVALVADCDENVPDILRGDPGRFGQVVTNLVSNAVKFTHDGQVVVRIGLEVGGQDTAGGSLLRVEVADTGIGIPLPAQAALFDSFTQADASTTRQYGGTGLGLTISRRLVVAMGGEIGFSSHEGVGTTFWFTVPLQSPAGRVAALEPVHEEPLAARSGAGGTVLVAEDNELNRLVSRGMLEALGFTVQFAHDGEQAVRQVVASPRGFVAVLMDCQMPGMDGYEATRAIRSQEAPGHHLPIIAMTASVVVGEEQRCLASGMDDFMVKPVSLERLGGVLARWAAPAPAPAPSDRSRIGGPMEAAEVLDLDRVVMLEQLRPGQHSLFQQFVESFVLRAPDNAKAIHGALDERDASRLSETAHVLKGSAQNIGAVALGRLCAELEDAGRHDDLDSAREAEGQLDHALGLTLRALEQRALGQRAS